MGDSSVNKYEIMLPLLNEKQRRIYLASEAMTIGRGGISEVSRITGVARTVITAGIKDIKSGDPDLLCGETRIRREGAGRKSITETQPGIKEALEKLVSESTYGDPQAPLLWTTKSLRNLEKELANQGYTISYRKVGYLLKDLGYSLQQNQKKNQVGDQPPDRDAQFKHMNEKVKQFLADGNPVISIDCKKKENIGPFKNNGAEYAPENNPVEVLDHDFPFPELGKAAPYGVYDVSANKGYVRVGISADTAQFTVNTIRSWWNEMGHERYPSADRLLITADGGGSNGSRNRLWEMELQKFAEEAKLDISVCHFPTGTYKWKKVEHRLFSQITKNWRGRPLESLEIIVNLIAAPTTDTGLRVKCKEGRTICPTGTKITEEAFASMNLFGDEFYPNWNYTIRPITGTVR